MNDERITREPYQYFQPGIWGISPESKLDTARSLCRPGQRCQEEREFMRAVVEGLNDLESGRDVSLTEARRRLGLI